MNPSQHGTSIPNYLTFARILISLIIVATFYLESLYLQKFLSSSLFLIACITDFFDGYLARKLSSQSKLGEILDPVADKILVTSSLVMLIKYRDINEIPCIIILVREFFVSGLRSKGIALTSTKLAKVKTLLQMSSIFLLLISSKESDSLNYYVFYYGSILLWFSSIITLYTGYKYILSYIKVSKK